jgi:hypothetical protein
MFRIIILLAVLLGLSANRSSADELLRQGEAISGKLRLVRTHHPNGTPIEAYQIVADRPRDLANRDDFCGGTPPVTFHLFANEGQRRKLDPLLGTRVTVVGDKFFCSETAWHIGDAVVIEWHFPEDESR